MAIEGPEAADIQVVVQEPVIPMAAAVAVLLTAAPTKSILAALIRAWEGY
jgi:hypothetical protein